MTTSARALGRHWPWVGLLLITSLGAWLRFYRLSVLPPGLFGDETLVTLLAHDAVSARIFPIYFAQGFGGYHPAVVYLTMLARWLTGNHPLAVRFGVAAAGVASLPITFFGLRAIFQLDEPEGRAKGLALLGAFILAVTFPNILINRLGFEVMLPAPAGALVFGCLALALRTGRHRFAVLAGIALGLSLYTYYSAQLLPVAVVLALLWVSLAGGRPTWRRNATRLALITGASILVFAPLGLYFLRNPDMFLARAATTSAQTLSGGPVALPAHLANGTLRTLASFSLSGYGDVLARHNLPGHAIYDPFLSVLFWSGLVLALLRGRRRSSALLLAWLACMLLPTILTMTGNSPTFTRLEGALPAASGLAAVGGLALFDALARVAPRWAPVMLSIGLVFSLVVSVYDYFGRWASLPELFDAFQVGDWRAANLALQRSSDQFVFLSPELISNPAHAAFDLLLYGGPARDFPGPACLVYRDQPDQPETYIVDVLDDLRTSDRLAATYPTGHFAAPIMHEPGPFPVMAVFEVPAGARARPPARPSTAIFGDALQLLGFSLSSSALRPGDALTVTLYWQAHAVPLPDAAVFVHVYRQGGDIQAPGVPPEPVAQSDSAPCAGAFAMPRWRAGEIVVDEHTLTLPAEFSDGMAPLAVGVYGWPGLERYPVTAAEGLLPGQRLKLSDLTILH